MSFLNFNRRIVISLFAMLLLFTTARAQDEPIFKWNETTNGWEKDSTGAAVRISVAPDGSPWVVNSEGKIFHLFNGSWRLLPGRAKDIGAGADGSVWVIGGNLKPLEDGSIFKLDADGQGWSQVDGAAANVSISNSGAPWVVTTEGGIYRWVDGAFQQLPGEATDIGVGGDYDRAWVTGAHGGIFRLGRSKNWVQVPGDAFRVSVGPDGNPWVVTLQRTIYRWVTDKFELMPGRANDIGIGADGSVWMIGSSTPPDGSSARRRIAPPTPSLISTPMTEMTRPNRSSARRIAAAPPPLISTPMTEITPPDGSSAQRIAPPPPPLIATPMTELTVATDTPVAGGKTERLICRGSRDPNDFRIQSLSGSKPGYAKVVIDFAFYMDVAPGDKMDPGTCLFANRNYVQDAASRQGDPSRLIEEVADDTQPTAADYLRQSDKYWMFNVYHYVTPKGEHYFKVIESRQTGPITRID